jgi:hypothetical protein
MQKTAVSNKLKAAMQLKANTENSRLKQGLHSRQWHMVIAFCLLPIVFCILIYTDKV